MSKLSTHILDTAAGKPAVGVTVILARWENQQFVELKTMVTNSDGRTNQLLLDATEMQTGKYQLTFHVGKYFSTDVDRQAKELQFLDTIPIQFAITDASQSYHVPLLVTPWSYSTYKGS